MIMTCTDTHVDIDDHDLYRYMYMIVFMSSVLVSVCARKRGFFDYAHVPVHVLRSTCT